MTHAEQVNAPVIELLTLTADVVSRASDPDDFARHNLVDLGEQASLVQRAVEQNEAFRQRIAASPQWTGHLAVDAATRRVVGTCAFKGEPWHGVVEVAYFTFPAYERMGYGAAMCNALVDKARESGVVHTVRAHTLPEFNTSARLLTRCGFTHIGTVFEPDDGNVFRWERSIHLPG